MNAAPPRDVALVHPSLNRVGGAERTLATMIRVLSRGGFRVHLYTVDETDWGLVEREWGVTERPATEHWLTRRAILHRLPLRWLIFYVLLHLQLARAKRTGALTFNNYGEVTTILSDVAYIHSRPLAAAGVRENPYGAPLWPLAWAAYRALNRALSLLPQAVLVANSRYNAAIAERVLHRRAAVLYPPVRTTPDGESPEKKPQVLTVSRLAPGKNLGAIPAVASLLAGSCELVLAGSSPSGSPRAELRGPGIRVILNPTQARLAGLRDESLAYLSTQPTEAFGIAVVEAMDRGCVPLTPRSGGPWIDILQARQGVYGYGYDTPAEAADAVRLLLRDGDLRGRVAAAARRRARRFSEARFAEALTRLLTPRAVTEEAPPAELNRFIVYDEVNHVSAGSVDNAPHSISHNPRLQREPKP